MMIPVTKDPEWLRLVKMAYERLGYERLVGDLLGVKFNTVSAWLRGKIREPKDVENRVVKPLREYLKKNPVAKKNPRIRERLWQAMRIPSKFTRQELMATAEASEGWTSEYLLRLVKEQYVKVVHPGGNEVGDFRVYKLVRNTGPKAPFFTSDGLVDPNLDRGARR